MLNAISSAKNECIDVKKYQAQINESNPYEQQLLKYMKEYQKRLRKNQSLDFDDLIMTNNSFI